VRDVMQPLTEENTIGADADAMQALARMTRGGKSRLVVLDAGRLVGLIALKDLLKFFQLKVDLEGAEAPRGRLRR
jgi:CBS domain-containing protein